MVPISYVVVGYANLTNAFGQSVMLACIAVASIWPLEPRRIIRLLVLVVLVTLGLICHVSSLALLLATLLVLCVLYRAFGGQALRAPAWLLLLVTAIATVTAIRGLLDEETLKAIREGRYQGSYGKS